MGNNIFEPASFTLAQLAQARAESEAVGYRKGVEAAAKEVDCGGPDVCKPALWNGQCTRRTSGDCHHATANEIRALQPPTPRDGEGR